MNLWELNTVNAAYFVSGSGSNFLNLETYFRNNLNRVVGKIVIANRSQIGAREKAEQLGIPFIVLKENDFSSQEKYETELLDCLTKNEIDLICLAGYLKKVPVNVIDKFQNRIVNIHPALLPAFGGHGMFGIHVHEAVINHGCKVTGATTHFVTANYDEGQIILQDVVRISESDTPESLQKKVLDIEHRIFPETIKLLTTKPWITDGRVFKSIEAIKETK